MGGTYYITPTPGGNGDVLASILTSFRVIHLVK